MSVDAGGASSVSQSLVLLEKQPIRIRVLHLIVIAILVPLPLISKAQDLRALAVEDALGARSFFPLSPIAFSADGKWLAYTVKDNRRSETTDSQTNAKSGAPSIAMSTDICLLDIETGKTKNLTNSKGGNFQPTWSPDSRYLAFLSSRDASGQERLWAWNPLTGDLRMVSDIDIRGNQIEWTSDSRRLLVTVLPNGLSREDDGRKTPLDTEGHKTGDGRAPASTVRIYDSRPTSSSQREAARSDPWSLDGYLRDLVLVNADTGKSKVVVRGHRISHFLLSPDGSHVAYTIPKSFEKSGSQQILFDLVTTSLSTGERRVVASDVRFDFDGAAFSWAPDGRQLSFRTGGMEERNFDSYVVDAEGGNARNITTLPQQTSSYKSASPLWDAKGQHIYFISDGSLWRASVGQHIAVEVARISHRRITNLLGYRNLLWTLEEGTSTIVMTHDDAGKQDGFYKVSLASGASTKLLEREQCYRCTVRDELVAITRDGRKIAYFSEDAQNDSDLWIIDPCSTTSQRLTRLNPQYDKYRMGRPRLIDWLSDDGEQLRGVLLLPANYEEGKRYPLIVWVYGGNLLSNDFNRFGLAGTGPFNMQLLATRGYAVLLPDAPQHLGTALLDLAKSVLPGVNRVIEMGIANPDQIGVMGHSYGGYSVVCLLVQTKRFKAAVEADGYADLAGHYGEMDKSGMAFGTSVEEQGQGLMGGPPWQFRERYVENSPIFYLDRVQTPLLIAHGSEDSTVAPYLSDELFIGLRRLGREVQYAKYEGEGHSPLSWSYANQVDFCNRIIDWFELHLKTLQD